MPNKSYARGYYAEKKTQKKLEDEGYDTMRSGGSRGTWDVIAWDDYSIRYIQVKRDCVPPSKELRKIKKARVPKFKTCTKEIWIWETRNPEPEVSVIR